MIELQVTLEKGDGRRGLADRLEMALCSAPVQFRAGTYLVRIERMTKAEIEAFEKREESTSEQSE